MHRLSKPGVKESSRYKEGPLEKLKLGVMEDGTGFKAGGWETNSHSKFWALSKVRN